MILEDELEARRHGTVGELVSPGGQRAMTNEEEA